MTRSAEYGAPGEDTPGAGRYVSWWYSARSCPVGPSCPQYDGAHLHGIDFAEPPAAFTELAERLYAHDLRAGANASERGQALPDPRGARGPGPWPRRIAGLLWRGLQAYGATLFTSWLLQTCGAPFVVGHAAGWCVALAVLSPWVVNERRAHKWLLLEQRLRSQR